MLERIAIAPGHHGPTVAITNRKITQVRQQPGAQLVEALAAVVARRRARRQAGVVASGSIDRAIELVHVLSNEAGISDDVTLAACVLHDNLADTRMSYLDMRRQFGQVVAEVVAELAEATGDDLADRPQLRLHSAGAPSHRAKLITLAAQIVAVRELAGGAAVGASRGAATLPVLRAVVDSMRGTHATLESLFDEASTRLQ